jgi:hypothetical protein
MDNIGNVVNVKKHVNFLISKAYEVCRHKRNNVWSFTFKNLEVRDGKRKKTEYEKGKEGKKNQ